MTNKVINRDSLQKLYLQLYEILKEKIESGEWTVGSQIPTEDELCRTYDVSKATVRLAVAELVKDGYLRRQQGKGTFVCKRIIPEGLSMLTSFKELMLEAGVEFTTKILAQTVMMPTDDLSIKLNVPGDRHIIYIKRLRMVDGDPILLQETYIPYNRCPHLLNEDLTAGSVLEIIEGRCGVKITRVQDYIGMVEVSDEEGGLIGLKDGVCALLLEQYFYSGDEQIKYTRSVKRPDRFRFFIKLERKV